MSREGSERALPVEMIPVRQRFDGAHLSDMGASVRAAIDASGIRFAPGEHIAIAAGSRGIAQLPTLVRAAVDAVRRDGAHPFILPAMGSHGGATAEGQRAVLAGYGVDEASMGCPVVSSMRVVPLKGGSMPVYLSKDAHEADGVIVINRVKPHTDFHGPVESGLMKMLVIGLGKHAQALTMHRLGVEGLRQIPEAAHRVLQTGKIRMGIGVVENAYEQPCAIRVCQGEEIPAVDSALLTIARERMARLPFDSLDILIVDRMGKDISGTGLDTNIIGRIRIPGEPEPESPRIGMIIADALTPASHGNALGVGLCDIITEKLFHQIDLHAMTENVVTSGFLERGRIPIIARDIPQAVRWAMRALRVEASALRMARVRSTLDVSELLVTSAALDTARGQVEITASSPWADSLPLP